MVDVEYYIEARALLNKPLFLFLFFFPLLLSVFGLVSIVSRKNKVSKTKQKSSDTINIK